ncbi:hypothetical protein [Mesorhizobium australafricanum]|uniref:Uncharacterized protein n=1 Tax=Mesorhizobium australafricanum TaxID=3072311 RepID=A0ABU4WYF9_9HYPH|nr:hypothetical protein [Mesorhizobium sp. VK3E]MDX8441088.1 hypothetical protein [Mesorhizobium sp. VK3E]
MVATAEPFVLHIRTEQDAWDALQGVLDRTLDYKNCILDFDGADWLSAHFTYSGRNFDQSITPTVMRGLIEYQNGFYRTAALLLKSDDRITRLSDLEKESLELVFRVGKGSSDLQAKAEGQAKELGNKLIEKMNQKQVFVAVLLAIVLYFGSGPVLHYMDNQVEERRIESSERLEARRIEESEKGRDLEAQEKARLLDIIQGLVAEGGDKAKIVKRAIKASPIASDVADHNRQATDEILRNSGDADSVTIQGIKVDRETINSITKSTRAKSVKLVFSGLFLVVGVDSNDADSYDVRLEEVGGEGRNFIAQLEDPLVGSRYQRAISTAEWNHKPVTVHIVARKVGENIRDAKIVKAYAPRKARKKKT